MEKYKNARYGQDVNRMSSETWQLFKKEYSKARLKKSSPLFKQIIAEYKELLEREFGVGTFMRFQANQKRIEEYRKLLPKVEFYTDCGFLLPRVINEEESYEKKLKRRILKERLEKDRAVELRERIINSRARELIRLRYGMVIDFMCLEEDTSKFELYANGKSERYIKRGKEMELFLRIIEAKMQNEEELLQVLQTYFPGLYGAFLLLFRDAVQWICS